MSGSPRILFIDSAPFTGGAQKSLWTLITELRRRRSPLKLLTADRMSGGLLARASAEGIDTAGMVCHHWKVSLNGVLEYLADVWHNQSIITKAIKEFQPNVIHLNGVRSAMLLPKVSVPFVIHDRDIAMPLVVPVVLSKRLPYVVAISEAVAEKWRSVVPEKRLKVIPNPFNIASIVTEAVETPGMTEDAQPLKMSSGEADNSLRLVMAADFIPWKRHGLFLEAVAELRKVMPGLRVKAVLKGRCRDAAAQGYLAKLKTLARTLKVDDCVQFDERDVSALPALAQADIVVSCSENEPFGRTVVEALALGKPVVAVGGGGLTDILTGCPAGTLTSPSPSAIAEAIAMWQLPERRASVAAEACEGARRYDSAVVLPQFEDLYRQIMLTNH